MAFGQSDTPVLELDKPIEGTIEPKKSKSYQIKMESAQYLFVLVEYKGRDLEVKLYGNKGQILYEAGNLSGGSRIKTVFLASEQAGVYRLEVISGRNERQNVKYRVTIKELRLATEKDRFRASAEKAHAEGELLQSERKKESLQKAIGKYIEASSLFQSAGELSQQGTALTNLGLAHYALGQTEKSLDSFKKVLEVSQQTGNRNVEAKILNNIGSIYTRMSDFPNAIEYFTKSLKIVRELNIDRGEAAILINLGSIYKVKGEYEKALEYVNKSLVVYRKIGKKDSEANSLNSLGAIYDDMGEPQKALGFYNKSLKAFQEANQIRRQAVVLNNIGAIYSKLGDKKRALDIYLKVLTIVRESGNKDGEARSLGNIGSIYNYLNEIEKALDYFEHSLSLARQVKNQLSESITLTDIGLTYFSQGNSKKALVLYKQALTIAQEIEAKHQQARILGLIGKFFVSLNEEEKALKNFNKSLSIWKMLDEAYNQSQILFWIANIEKENGNFDIAEKRANTAVKLIENYRAKIGSQELRTSHFSTSQNIYKFYINLLMQLHKQSPTKGFDIKAFNVSEQAKARSMVENIAESRVKIREGVNAQLLKRERKIQKQLNKKASERIRFANRKGGEKRLVAIKEQINTLLNEYKDIKTQIRISSPRYADLTEPRFLTLKNIQKSLDSETVLLEYSLGKKHSYVWVIKANSITSYELPKNEDIRATANKVHSLLISRNLLFKGEIADQRGKRVEKSDRELVSAVRVLSKQIIDPVSKQFNKKRIIVVAEGILQYIPFGALSHSSSKSKQKYQPLVLRHEIVTLPSASILEVLRNKPTSTNLIPNSVAVIADPVFSKSDPRVAQSIGQLKNQRQTQNAKLNVSKNVSMFGELNRSANDLNINVFRRLRFSRREANDITSFAPKGSTFKAVDFVADRDLLLRQDLSKYKILHFATHGLLNNKNPELSGLVLSLVDERGKPKDGFLRLHDIYNMKIGADLVVLSACQTALGKEVKGEGLIGLTRGFMYAGANTVVASLWKVEDRATAELMKKFYRAMLKDGQKPAAALRTAQVEMFREGRWSNPYYWAAFTLQGEWK